MSRYIFRRLLLLIPVIILVSFIVFALMDLAPGDRMSQWDLGNMTQEEVAAVRAQLGLDDPMLIRYGRYMFRLVQGDLGTADLTGFSVWESFMARLPNTLVLAAAAIIIGVSISIPLGIYAARRSGSVVDNITTAFTMLGMSMPGFWLGILMMLIFAYKLNWLPAGGFNQGIRSVILPGICAAMTLLAQNTRQTRSSMLEVLKADYLRTARAKGVPDKVVIRKHALGNALIPIVTTIGMSLAHAISGTAVIETVFAWPGIGRLLVEAVAARDVTSITGLTILTAVMYVFILLFVDLAYAFLDPRIRAQYTNVKKKKKSSDGLLSPASPDTDAGGDEDGVAATQPERSVLVNETTSRMAHDFSEVVAKFGAGQEQDEVPDEAPRVSFATRTDFESSQGEIAEVEADSEVPVVTKHRKRSRGNEVARHLLRNPGAIAGLVIIFLMLVCFVVSLCMSFESISNPNVQHRLSPPTFEFLFGTDNMGRNLFLRVIYAARFSLPIGVGATAFSAVVGVLLGSFAAYREGSIGEEIIMRFSDIIASVPGMLLGMVIITVLGRSLPNLIIAISILALPVFIRISRASVLSIKGNEFVEAARAIGLPEARILYNQVLPNGLAPIIIIFTASLGTSILVSAGLSFLGFGIPVPNPEWGSLVSAGRDAVRTAPWLTTFPGLFIMITVMGFNMLGDGLRDAFDPKLKR